MNRVEKTHHIAQYVSERLASNPTPLHSEIPNVAYGGEFKRGGMRPSKL